MATLAAWDGFYVIVGAAAGALIGLEFVVVALLAGRPRSRESGSAFATPTIVHFAVALLLAALLRAPWPGAAAPRIAWGAVGVIGGAYALAVLRPIRRLAGYHLTGQDWFFYFALPLAAYATLVVSALLAVGRDLRGALFAVAAAVLTLLFTGIHNAWDSVAYHVFSVPADSPRPRENDPGSAAAQPGGETDRARIQ